MAEAKYYITTAIPYVNAKPHIGHALEYVVADAIVRYWKQKGRDVRLVSGADENALKNVQAAEKAKKPIQKFLDENSKIFEEFYKLLEVNLDEFRRGTDEKYHWPGVQKLWELAYKNGDIYKKKYKGLYCVGCEAFKTEKDLVGGKCPEHDKEPVEVEEENYFFKLSKYQDKLLDLIETGKYEITPEKRKNEIISFIKSGLEDFSISRGNKRAKGVGVPVPNDPNQKIYVWFDALTIYLTASGWGYNEAFLKKWWPAELHIIGKDIIRFHAVYWPAMLLSAGLELPKKLLVHGFITSSGRKMSKSLGNVIDPYEIIEKYGVEALRYYLLSQIPTLDDGDFTIEHFENVYQADLANGLGNLISRVSSLCGGFVFNTDYQPRFTNKYTERFNNFNLKEILEHIKFNITVLDKYLDDEKPWKIKDQEKLRRVLQVAVDVIRQISFELQPFLPKTAEEIKRRFSREKIIVGKPLFPRLN